MLYKGLLKSFKWYNCVVRLAFSKDISGYHVENVLEGARLDVGGFLCDQVRAGVGLRQ